MKSLFLTLFIISLAICYCGAIKTNKNKNVDKDHFNDYEKEIIRIGNEQYNECEICQMIVQDVSVYLKNNQTIADIEHELEKVCIYIPGHTQECRSLVDKYVIVICDYLANQSNPSAICQEVHLCSNSSGDKSEEQVIPIPMKPNEVVAQKRPHNSHDKPDQLIHHRNIGEELAKVAQEQYNECSICQLIVEDIATMLKNNKTVQEIEAELEKLCNYVPGHSSECTSEFKNLLSFIISFISNNSSDPQVVCKEIKMCISYSLQKHFSAIKSDQLPPLIAQVVQALNDADFEIIEIDQVFFDMDNSDIEEMDELEYPTV